MNHINRALYFIFISYIIFCSNDTIAQDNNGNNAELWQNIELHDSVRLKMLRDTIWYFIDRDLNKTKELIVDYQKIVTKIGNERYRVDLCNIRSAYFNYLGMDDSSIYYLEESIDIIKAIESDSSFVYGKNQLPFLYSNIAIIYEEIGMYETSIEFQFKCMFELEDILTIDSMNTEMQILYANSNTELGMYYSEFDDKINAEKYFVKGIELANKYNDDNAVAYAEFNYGVYLSNIGEIDTALVIFFNLNNYYKLINDQYSQIMSMLNISDVYNKQVKYKLAMNMSDSCILLSEKYGFYSLYRKSKKVNFIYSINVDDPRLSISLGNEYLIIAEQVKDKLGVKEVLFEMAKIYYEVNELDKAYSYLLKSKIIGDSIVDRDRKANVSILESKYKLIQTNIENKILIREGIVKDKFIKKQKDTNRIIIALLVCTSIFGYILFIGRRKMKRINTKLNESNSLLEEKTTELNNYNSVLERTFSIVSHDLKGPIGTADSFFKMLNDKDNDITDDQRDNYISIVGKSMSVTYNMLEELLIWSRQLLIWSRQRLINKVVLSEFSLYKLVDSIISNIESTVFTKNISIVNSVDTDSVIKSNSNYLRIVIRNIITNAIKFTNEGGEIIISFNSTDDSYSIRIKDNGVGMNNDVLMSLFVDNDSKNGTNNEQGTGLGLLISKRIIKTIEGDILVESKEGVYSIFTIVLKKNAN